MPAKRRTGTTDKLDLFKLHRDEYVKPRTPALIEAGPASYLVVAGEGAPGDNLFQERLGALYAMAYTLKFASKLAGRDYTVGKLEALYGVDGQRLSQIADTDLSSLRWHMLMRVPEFIGKTELTAARTQLQQKGKPGDFGAVVLESLREGRCVQMLHLGPYDQESRTVAALRDFAESADLTPRSWQHDIYLSDPRRVDPERLKTIVRLPVGARTA